ncbi:response regulator [Virgibacillus sp. NKC19-16]|uniref:response regulator n=1 Tax=Virgibacillus salidurans TaxID=2831673 RepID=UPI001F2ABBB7|nr:response regulator [Virgibacillus sp. NKC19-16]UJL47662.1 response regulator [Virgibacillus sp. NKC19-16]
MIDIVIAEDDFRIANIHEAFLGKMDGIKVIGKALTGEQTLSLTKELKPDLILLDIYLPDYLGTDLIPKLRDVHPRADIIIITAAKEKELLEESMRKGITNYLIKPVSLDRFATILNEYKKQKDLLKQKEYIDQATVDELLLPSMNRQAEEGSLPKGIDQVTLAKVQHMMEEEKKSWSAQEMGKQIGSSRTTARRYMEYLVSEDVAKVEQEYGIIGRPERRYSLC